MNIVKKYPIWSLVVLSLTVGGLWRAEVEYHGWGGLVWLEYVHLAFPAGFALFLIWMNLLIVDKWWRRLLLGLLAVIYMSFALFIFLSSLIPLVVTGPAALWLRRAETPMEILIASAITGLVTLAIPLGAAKLLDLFDHSVPRKFIIVSSAGMLLSIPVSMIVLRVVKHIGGDDILHCMKSGILWVFWTASIGIIVLGARQRQKEEIAHSEAYWAKVNSTSVIFPTK